MHSFLLLGFYVTVFGQALAHWTETRSRTTGTGENRRTENYTGMGIIHL